MSQIREQRCIMATKVFPQKLDLAAVVEHKDCVSDIEEAANPTHLPVRKIGSWREHSLTQVLHYLDKMTQAEATHHKTIAVNNQVYGRSESKIYSCKGINQVPRNLPQDCYSRLWWDSLTKFEQETVSKVAPCGIKKIEEELTRNTTHPPPPSNARPGPSDPSTAGPREVNAGQPADKGKSRDVGGGSMNVD